MEIFKLTLSQMLMMFTLITVGVLLRKTAVLNPRAGNIMARIETYVFVPTLLRLVVIPAAALLVLRAIGASDLIQTLALIVLATPLGLNTIVYPAAYGGDTKTGASMAMISHVLSVITIPLMYLVFIVWL